MRNNKIIKYWIKLSDYDIEVAESLYEKNHYLYSAFMCHQAIEKILKAIYVYKYNQPPPYTHRLYKLIQLNEIEDVISEEKKEFILKLEPYNIEARYPSYKKDIKKYLSSKKSLIILKTTKEIQQWLKSLIQIKK